MLIQGAKSDLVEFDRRLRAIAPEGQVPRPFLCRGSPLGCDVFLVGINPGTDTPLWHHWSLEKGCDKDGWLADYLGRHGRLKPTRARIERICESAGRDRVLETNVFHVPSARERQLPKADRRTGVFDFLLETLRPRVMFVHGRSAVAVKRLSSGDGHDHRGADSISPTPDACPLCPRT